MKNSLFEAGGTDARIEREVLVMLTEKAEKAIRKSKCRIKPVLGDSAFLVLTVPEHGFKVYLYSPYGVFDDLELYRAVSKEWRKFDTRDYANEHKVTRETASKISSALFDLMVSL